MGPGIDGQGESSGGFGLGRRAVPAVEVEKMSGVSDALFPPSYWRMINSAMFPSPEQFVVALDKGLPSGSFQWRKEPIGKVCFVSEETYAVLKSLPERGLQT